MGFLFEESAKRLPDFIAPGGALGAVCPQTPEDLLPFGNKLFAGDVELINQASITFLLALSFAVAPFLGNEFGGYNPEHFPIAQRSPAVQPAGYAFAIWGIIYLWLLVGMGFGLVKRRDDSDWQAMRPALMICLAVGTVWLQVAVRSPVWGTILIWAMLISALFALFKSPSRDSWFAALPVGLLAGWLSAASCVSLGLIWAGYGFVSEQSAALTAILLGLCLASAVQTQLRSAPSYGIAVIWALIAIVVQNAHGNSTVAALAIGGAIAMLMLTWKAADR